MAFAYGLPIIVIFTVIRKAVIHGLKEAQDEKQDEDKKKKK
jgi:hypothetical protein